MSKLKLRAIGHLGRDCSIRHIDSGSSAISFPIACTEKYKDRQGNNAERTTWVDCTLWRKPDQLKVAEFLKKGMLVAVEGMPSTRGYKAKSTDEIKSSLLMRVDELEFLGGAKTESSTQPSTTNVAAAETETTEVFTSSAEGDDLPF